MGLRSFDLFYWCWKRAAKHPYFAALSAVIAASVVGVTGIEPAPSWSQTKRLTIRQHPEIFNFFSTMVKPVVRPIFPASARCNFLAFPPFFARLLAFLKHAAENDCTLPNVARYQLRHTPKCEKYSIFRSFSVSGQICGQNILSVFFWKGKQPKKSIVYTFSQAKIGFSSVWKIKKRKLPTCSQTPSLRGFALPLLRRRSVFAHTSMYNFLL